MLMSWNSCRDWRCLEGETGNTLLFVKTMFFWVRPGHGAPTPDIRKKKFTEHQLGPALRRSQSVLSLEDNQVKLVRPYRDDMNLDPRVSVTRWSLCDLFNPVVGLISFHCHGLGTCYFIIMPSNIVPHDCSSLRSLLGKEMWEDLYKCIKNSWILKTSFGEFQKSFKPRLIG